MPWSTLRRERPFAVVDVGSVRTRAWLSGQGLVLDEPTVVGIWADDRRRPVLGSAALRAANDDHEVNVRRPLRGGRIVEDGAAVSLLRALLREIGVRRSTLLVMTVPIGGDDDRHLLRRILRDARAPRRQLLVDAPVAAAADVGLLPAAGDRGLVVDVGAGLAEALAVDPGRPWGQGWCEVSGDDPLAAAVVAARRALSSAPEAIRGGVTVTGGWAGDPRLLDGLAAELDTPCRPAPEPSSAVVRGAARLAAGPDPMLLLAR